MASSLICARAKLPPESIIPATVISFAVSLGWDIVSALDRSAMNDALLDMDYTSLMCIKFMTANSYLVKGYEAVDLPSSNVTWDDGSSCFKYTNIPNPIGKYGNWHLDTIGFPYKL